MPDLNARGLGDPVTSSPADGGPRKNIAAAATRRKNEASLGLIDNNRGSGTSGRVAGPHLGSSRGDGPHLAYAEARKELEDGHVVANEKRGEAG